MDNFNFDFNNNDFTWSDGTPVQPWTDDNDDPAFNKYVLAMFQPDNIVPVPSQPAYSQPANQNPARQYPVAQPQMQEIAPIWQQQQQQMATPPVTPPQMAYQPSATFAAPFPQQQQMLAWSARVQSARVQSARRLRWTGPQLPTDEAILAASQAVPAKDRMSSDLGSRSGRSREDQIIFRRQQKALNQIKHREAKKAAKKASSAWTAAGVHHQYPKHLSFTQN
ncbi:hypothetical protein LTR27_001594 [Elasticomyces elasticus]|nr:hypothetical protein LTR27_001594 [Elasticomyces elasticus]